MKRKIIIFFLFKSAMKLMTRDMSRLKWVTNDSVITLHAKISPTIVLITGHFSNSAKFHEKGQIQRLRSNFRGPPKNVGPSYD